MNKLNFCDVSYRSSFSGAFTTLPERVFRGENVGFGWTSVVGGTGAGLGVTARGCISACAYVLSFSARRGATDGQPVRCDGMMCFALRRRILPLSVVTM